MTGACRLKSSMWKPARFPETRTKVMLIVGDPAQAFHLAAIPNEGVGLARLEFIVTNHIGIHPMALAQFPNLKDPKAVNEIRQPDRAEKIRVNSLFGASAKAWQASPRLSIPSRSSSGRAISKPMNMRDCSAARNSSRRKKIP